MPINNVVAVNFGNNKITNKNNEKKQIFEELLLLGTVSVIFDARLGEVKIPSRFCGYSDLRLNFCYQFHIADFNFNDVGVWATLSFDEGDFFCFVPWKAIYGIQGLKDNKIFSWPSSFPKDISSDLVDELGKEEKSDLLGKVIKIDFSGFSKNN